VTLKQYYKAFWGLFGILAATPPLLAASVSSLLPEGVSVLRFPPLGDVEPFARLGLVALSLLTIHLIYFWNGGKWLMGATATVALLCLSLYVAIYPRFVIRIDIPSQDPVHVSIGYARTQFAATNFPGYSDENLVRARGATDEEIRRLWTYNSIALARLGLFLSYAGFLWAFTGTLSLGIRFELLHFGDKHDSPPRAQQESTSTG
jgi:hypothetical protein